MFAAGSNGAGIEIGEQVSPSVEMVGEPKGRLILPVDMFTGNDDEHNIEKFKKLHNLDEVVRYDSVYSHSLLTTIWDIKDLSPKDVVVTSSDCHVLEECEAMEHFFLKAFSPKLLHIVFDEKGGYKVYGVSMYLLDSTDADGRNKTFH